MDSSADQITDHWQRVHDILNPLRELDIMHKEELLSLRAELVLFQRDNEECRSLLCDKATTEQLVFLLYNYSLLYNQKCVFCKKISLERKVAMLKLEREEAEVMLEKLEREHQNAVTSTAH